MYRDGPEFDILFYKIDGLSARRAQVDRATQEIDRLSEKDILSKNDDELVLSVSETLAIAIPVLKRGDISFERKMQEVTRRNDWGEMSTREVAVFYFDVPYEGEDVFFTMRPSSYDLNPPRGQARGNVLRLSIVGEQEAANLQRQVKDTLDQVDKYLTWHRELWAGVEAEIANATRGRLAYRRQKLSSLGQAEAGLADLGFKPKGS